MASSTGDTSPVVENAPPLATMELEAKMIVATGRDHCQQLKDMLSQVEGFCSPPVTAQKKKKDMLSKEDRPSSMVLVVAVASTPPKPRSPSPAMDSGLLALACSGSSEKLESFLNGEGRRRSTTIRSFAMHRATGDEEAFLGKNRESSLLDGVTVGGDTALHVVAGAGDNRDGDDIMKKARLIHSKVGDLLFVKNSNGDTPLHCAARAANLQMVSLLIDLAKGEDNNANKVKALLETENKSNETALHEAVRVGNNDIVELLMKKDPVLARFPNDGTSPMYLAILLKNKVIAETLHKESGGVLSYSGPNGQNALHAAVLRGTDLTRMLLRWDNNLSIKQDENGSTPLHLAASMLPEWDLRLYLAASMLPKWDLMRSDRRTTRLLLLEANPDQLYQQDNDGLLPTHVAAAIDATDAITDFLEKSPSCAGLRDARGRTFLHVAVEKMKAGTVSSACINQSLSWVLNMQDNDGNTALHLAVQKGSLTVFCAMFGNRKVHLNLTNKKGETPLDIAHYNQKKQQGLRYNQNSEAKIQLALDIENRANKVICRQDYFEEEDIVEARQNEVRQIERLKDGTQDLCIGAVLIATVTFGATFAMPGGYRADDHINGGTPTLAGRYDFDAFILANALAFAFSVMAVISLMSSGSPMHNLRSRVKHLKVAFAFMNISLIGLVAAFALGTYMMLAPVDHKVVVAVCVLSAVVLLYANIEPAIQNAMLVAPFCRRRGICDKTIWTFPLSALTFMYIALLNLWPIVVILGLAAVKYAGHKVEPAAQPPTPLA